MGSRHGVRLSMRSLHMYLDYSVYNYGLGRVVGSRTWDSDGYLLILEFWEIGKLVGRGLAWLGGKQG
jgi:hypothetical protein